MPKVEMLKDAQIGGAPHFAGEVVDATDEDARYMLRAGKVRLVDAGDEPVADEPEPTDETEPEDEPAADAEPEPPVEDEPEPEPEPKAGRKK